MKNPKSFYKKLKKLIEDVKPENCEIVYDMGSCEIFVIKKGFNFNEGSNSLSGTSWHGVLTPVNEPSNDVGHESKSIIGEGIYVPLEAVQS